MISRRRIIVLLLALGLAFGTPGAAAHAEGAHSAIPTQSSTDFTCTANGCTWTDGRGNGANCTWTGSAWNCNGSWNGGGWNCTGNVNNVQCNVPEAPAAVDLPLVGLVVLGAFAWFQRRRTGKFPAVLDPE